MFKTLLAAAAAFALITTGCNKSEPGGQVGTKDSFKLVGPTIPDTIKQGDRKTLTISLDRGSDFKRDVALEVTAPKGLKVDLANKSVKASDPKDVPMTVEADKDAAVGEHLIAVKGTPSGGGTATTLDVKVKIEAK